MYKKFLTSSVLYDDILYTCGTIFDCLELPGCLTNIFVKDHRCADSVEKLYYLCDFKPICVNCMSVEITNTDSDFLVLSSPELTIRLCFDRNTKTKFNRNKQNEHHSINWKFCCFSFSIACLFFALSGSVSVLSLACSDAFLGVGVENGRKLRDVGNSKHNHMQ